MCLASYFPPLTSSQYYTPSPLAGHMVTPKLWPGGLTPAPYSLTSIHMQPKPDRQHSYLDYGQLKAAFSSVSLTVNEETLKKQFDHVAKIRPPEVRSLIQFVHHQCRVPSLSCFRNAHQRPRVALGRGFSLHGHLLWPPFLEAPPVTGCGMVGTTS